MLLLCIFLLNNTVYYSADKLIYDFEEGKIVLQESARVDYRNIKVISDSLVYDTETKDVRAYKNPILCIDKDTIYGKTMAYNLDSEKGIATDGRSKIEKGWFEGKTVRMVAPRTLNVDNGKFTTCELNPPHYYFWAKSLKIYVDDMVYARPLVLFVQDIPVFFLPFWFFPIKSGRSSGLLFPKVGRSSTLGRYVRDIAYYWVISDYMDMTFSLDYMEKKGLALGISSVWLYRPRLSGNLDAQYVDENGVKRRWKVKLSHRHNTRDGTVIVAKGDFVSDLSFNMDYEDNVISELEQVISSYLSLSKRLGPFSTGLIVRETRDLKTDGIIGDYPRITISAPSIGLFGGLISYSGIIRNSVYTEDVERRSENNLRFTLPKRLWYFNISPAVGGRLILSYADNSVSYENFYNGSIGIGTVLYGRSILRSPEFRHTIKPYFYYKFSRSNESHIENIGVSIQNDFMTLSWNGNKIDLGRIDIGSTWNFETRKWNPVGIVFMTSQISGFSLRGGLTWDIYSDRLYGKYLISNYSLSRGNFRMNLTYNVKEDSDESIWGTISMKPTSGWRIEGNVRYDLRNGMLINERISLKRDLHCWELQFNYQKYGDRWNYDFRLYIKAIPEVKVGKDIMEMLLGS